MNVIRCKNGHFFDGDSYGTCPHCGEAAITAGIAAPAKEEKRGLWGRGRKEKEANVQPASMNSFATTNRNIEIGNTPTDVIENKEEEKNLQTPQKKDLTLDFWQTASHPKSKEENEINEGDETLQTTLAEESPAEEIAIAPSTIKQLDAIKNVEQREKTKANEQNASLLEAVKKSSASNEGKTMSYFSSATGSAATQSQVNQPAEPVVGWLVCVGGCHFGECFNIYAGKNSVGRSEENRIVISDDNSISRSKHALIVYEPKKRNFYLQPGDSSGLTYLNEDYITESHKLGKHDMIELGDSKFMFVPLCGETFSWEEHMPKGE